LVKSVNLRKLIQKNRRGRFLKRRIRPEYELHHLLARMKLEEDGNEV